jgi:ribokinase
MVDISPTSDVIVVGSINRDLTVFAPHHPAPGETVLGTGHFNGAGGKGANQAVAAARLGASCAMIGRVGDDDQGRFLVTTLIDAGVDTTAVETDSDAPTGLAVITLDARGENAIVVSPGANQLLRPEQVRRHADRLTGAKVCLAQLEVPVESVIEAARSCSGLFVLNLAPALPVPDELLQQTDVLVVNRSELASLTGSEDPTSVTRIEGPGAVVVTLGGEGALFSEGDRVGRFPAPDVDVVDTTGAGDAFCGALAAAFAREHDLPEAVRWAVAAGALATTRPGAQTSMPTFDDVEALYQSASPPQPTRRDHHPR